MHRPELGRRRWSAARRAATAATAVLLAAGGACSPPDRDAAGDTEAPAAEEAAGLPEHLAEPPGTPGADVDRALFREKVAWASQQGIDSLAIGDMVAALARTFVGEPYTPGTLEAEGAERLVVNLREFDCVTLVENVLALARVIRSGEEDFDAFLRELQRIRYRGGRLGGYETRLHYFSEWIQDNERKGLMRDVTEQLGGAPDSRPIHFMTSNAGEYRQLGDPEVLEAIREIERRLSQRTRFYIPEREIPRIEGGLRDGDIIATRSTLAGLDVAHTGFVVHVDGRPHLLHAPLVGSHVELSELPLAARLLRIPQQDAIMVARPL